MRSFLTEIPDGYYKLESDLVPVSSFDHINAEDCTIVNILDNFLFLNLPFNICINISDISKDYVTVRLGDFPASEKIPSMRALGESVRHYIINSDLPPATTLNNVVEHCMRAIMDMKVAPMGMATMKRAT